MVPSIEIILSLDALDSTHKGYQPPIDEALVTEENAEEVFSFVTEENAIRHRGECLNRLDSISFRQGSAQEVVLAADKSLAPAASLEKPSQKRTQRGRAAGSFLFTGWGSEVVL